MLHQIDPPLKGLEDASLSQLQSILEQESAACFIFEPFILGLGGMIIYPPHGLDKLIQCCKQHKVLTIADEVMTGFGRTQEPCSPVSSLRKNQILSVCLRESPGAFYL